MSFSIREIFPPSSLRSLPIPVHRQRQHHHSLSPKNPEGLQSDDI